MIYSFSGRAYEEKIAELYKLIDSHFHRMEKLAARMTFLESLAVPLAECVRASAPTAKTPTNNINYGEFKLSKSFEA